MPGGTVQTALPSQSAELTFFFVAEGLRMFRTAFFSICAAQITCLHASGMGWQSINSTLYAAWYSMADLIKFTCRD
jgi:hypothetical protein